MMNIEAANRLFTMTIDGWFDKGLLTADELKVFLYVANNVCIGRISISSYDVNWKLHSFDEQPAIIYRHKSQKEWWKHGKPTKGVVF